MSADVLLRDGCIVDGTGAPWFRGSVAVTDGTISAIVRRTDDVPDADEVVALHGAVVCPGFIDLHSHSDLELFADPLVEPKLRQGITTEILGQDGFSMAPIDPTATLEWRAHLRGLAGDIDHEWTWGTTGEYFDAIEAQGVAPNVAMLVGHGTVRYDVLGMADRDPTADELDEMADRVTESLEAGALGFSTGLVYPPQVNASTEEVATLATRLRPFGRPFVAHIRSEGRGIWDALDEFIDIGAEHEIPLHVSHFKVSGKSVQGRSDRVLELVEVARARGIDVTADKYPYAAGNTMLTAVLPPWVHADGPDGVRTRLRDPAARERIRRDIEEWRIDGWENNAGKTGWENLVVTNLSDPDLADVEGRTVAEIAEQWDCTPVDAVCDVLLAEDLSVSMITHSQSEADVQTMLVNERIGLGTDGLFGGRPHPRTYGSYPRVLGRYVREKGLLTLEEAVRKMTSLPARAMGLETKGVLRPGLDADLVVFDPDVIASRATYDDPCQHPVGISHVIVDGQFTIQNGKPTDARPGAVIRA